MMNPNAKGPTNPRYKTQLCKNFLTEQGCQYGDKCQFAHGPQELRTMNSQPGMQEMLKPMQQYQKNIINYKIVKCKNWEKDGTCKYGSRCSFAHGDGELRAKMDPQLVQMQMNQMGMMMGPGYMDYPMMMPGMQMDYSQMDPNMMMGGGQYGMPMPMDMSLNDAQQAPPQNSQPQTEQH